MAGMLPGVECARRRRVHGNTISSSAVEDNYLTRHSFSLYYPTNFESLMLPSSLPTISLENKRKALKHEDLDEDMGRAAREAKQKLDDKFRQQRKLEAPENKRKRLFWWFLIAYAPCKLQNTSSILQPNH
ncbi:hypothetical protein HN51_064102 [Arachis hypogaea]|nr:uncharacterized protein DS421_11g349020 [Arachis hypogaea]